MSGLPTGRCSILLRGWGVLISAGGLPWQAGATAVGMAVTAAACTVAGAAAAAGTAAGSAAALMVVQSSAQQQKVAVALPAPASFQDNCSV